MAAFLNSSIDGDREGLMDDKSATAEDVARLDATARKAFVSSEPANPTLLTPFRAQYHRFLVAGLVPLALYERAVVQFAEGLL